MKNNNYCVIVGNGFDVGHGLPSRYSDFKEWLRNRDQPLYDFLERYIDVSGEWWNEFEKNLSEFDIPRLIKETPLVNSPRIPNVPPSFSHPASWRLDAIRKKISERFTEWIKGIEVKTVKQIIDLPDASLYISFNYTDTLERVYGIDTERILYIHGKALRDDKLIFGHGKNHFLLESDVMLKYGLHRSEDFLTAGSFGDAEYELSQHISYWEKRPYDQLIRYNEILHPAVMAVHIACVYGLSFSEVDYPYIEWIARHNPNIQWKASWHTEEDKNHIRNTFEVLNVRDYELFYL